MAITTARDYFALKERQAACERLVKELTGDWPEKVKDLAKRHDEGTIDREDYLYAIACVIDQAEDEELA